MASHIMMGLFNVLHEKKGDGTGEMKEDLFDSPRRGREGCSYLFVHSFPFHTRWMALHALVKQQPCSRPPIVFFGVLGDSIV